MEPRTKKTFGWICLIIGCLLIGIPIAAYMNSTLTAIPIVTGILGIFIAINGARFIHRANKTPVPRKHPRKRKR